MVRQKDTEMADAPSGRQLPEASDVELDEKYPNRPRNHSPTLPFHDLPFTLFNPLLENLKKPRGPVISRKKQGPHGGTSLPSQEVRRNIIERFISRWRKEVGNDIYPAFRLIIPEKDRDRGMYGVREAAIGKLLVKVMRLNKDSEDAQNIIKWKLPGQTAATSRMAGDFAGRCYEVLMKRPLKIEYGDITIGEVNVLLDELSMAPKEDSQLPIFEELYARMNPEELLWLIRIILRQMKIGATERTIFEIWHPDAESLFSVTSSLRRVCWDLYDPSFRLEGDDRGVTLMQCFQPQLAQFQMHSFQKMVEKMRPTEDDNAFWIEEKLDGERMQLHMVTDPEIPGGKRFAFWSRKAKDYTYLYGEGFFDENAALTRHIKESFHEGVQNIILDGEMITWDPEQDAMVPFGTLKTAALSEQRNPFSNTGERPLLRVFDILYLNGKDLTNYTLRDRRRALEASVKSIHRRMEIHTYQEARSATEIEPLLRKVVAEASEGLVLKNPRSPYRLNDRNDDWLKVKPEYMTEFGESLDCVVIGGYYGSGSRGGKLSSFLCGLRVDENQFSQSTSPMKCYSFFKVGGGFTANDYSNVRHRTDGKWIDWDSKRPPKEYIELAGGDLQTERPDVWIKPSDSVVLSVKAASITVSESFRVGYTIRFPRFKALRENKDWTSAISVQEFMQLKSNIEREQKEKAFQVDDWRKKRIKKTRKKALTVAGGGGELLNTPYAGPTSGIFDGLSFYILSESLAPEKRSKPQLEVLVKVNGGKIFQRHDAVPDTICIADRRVVKVAALEKSRKLNIVRPKWLFDCIKQSEIDAGRPKFLLPYEPGHMFVTLDDAAEEIAGTVDEYGDSYARDVTIDELHAMSDNLPRKFEHDHEHEFNAAEFKKELEEHGHLLGDLPGWMFEGFFIYADKVSEALSNGAETNSVPGQDPAFSISPLRLSLALNTARFANGELTEDMDNEEITHVLVNGDRERTKKLREHFSKRKRGPRFVTVEWIERSWENGTLLDEERFAPH